MAPSPSSTTGPPADLTGKVLASRYRLNRPIAAGGMAQVWEATDQTLARRVAVKILHPHLALDESFVRRFRQEAIASARLAHPSIVSVYDTLATDGVNAIVMELVTGTTMRADLDQHGPLRLTAVLAIGTQVADALGAAHASGLVHRDVKPANILLSTDGRVLVADFGIAKAAQGADVTTDGSMVGTAKYLAPEQVEGNAVDGRTDLYALGIVLYEGLTGSPPFVADTDLSTALARLHRDPTPPRRLRPEIPPAVEDVVTRALARRPDDRYPDAAAMRRALLAAGADPSKARAVAQAAVAADTGERPASSRPNARPARPAPPAGRRSPAPPPPSRPSLAPPSPAQPRPMPPAYTGPRSAVDHDRRRRWPWVAAALGLAGAVAALGFTLAGGEGSGSPSGTVVAITQVGSFDPVARDGENEARLLLVVDGDPATGWSTEEYGDPDVTAFKGGVGLVITVDQAFDLGQLDIDTSEGGWSADVYVTAGEVPVDLAGWGEPVEALSEVETGTVEVDLDGRRGRMVLIWFTRLAPAGDEFAAQVSEVELRRT